MSNDENKTKEDLPANQPEGLAIHPNDRESWFADLFDLRVLVFLVSIVVIAMTATVLIFSSDPDESGSTKPGAASQSTKAPASISSSSETNQAATSDPATAADKDVASFTKPLVEQAGDGSFVLPFSSAVVTGCEVLSTGISNWQSGGSAQWRLAVRDRRTGFFRCYVTYVARFESQFGVQLGDRKPLKFTIYPKETDFTEQFIIRLDTPEESSLRLIANQIEKVSGVTIKKIVLVPR
jgi:hypothetical protein